MTSIGLYAAAKEANTEDEQDEDQEEDESPVTNRSTDLFGFNFRHS